MLALANALQNNVSLHELNLTSSLFVTASQQPQCNNHSTMLLPLALAIQQHPYLTILHLSYNRLVDVSCLAYCISNKQQQLQGCSKSLTALHLDYNHLTATTALALAQVLSTNQTQLKTLMLNSNRIGDEGGVAIGKALHHNTTLRELGLKNNQLGDKTGHAFFEMLQRAGNVTVTSLLLAQNPNLSLETLLKVQTLTEANHYGRYLLYNNTTHTTIPVTAGKNNINNKISTSHQYQRHDKNKQHHDNEEWKRKLWPLVLAKLPVSLLFYFLVEKPSLIPPSLG
jgi:hypothetical protein